MPQINLFGTEGLDSIQNNGFKSTANAVAEIVDNAIQAEADTIKVILRSKNEGGYQKVKDIIIVDNGSGMSLPVFRQALSFQSGGNFGATRGLGRYGMGLPNSSVSQTKRFEVYTWQTINDKKIIYHNYMDIDEIKESGEPLLPEPSSVSNIKKDRLLSLVDIETMDKGTIVIWRNLNRVRPTTTKSLINHLERHLGRMFRYYLNGFEENGERVKSNIGIKVIDDNGEEFDEIRTESIARIKPFDPLFLMENTQTKDIYPDEDFNGITSVKQCKDIEKTFTINGEKHPVKLIFSKFKKEVRDKIGSNPGSSELGKLYLYRNNRRSKPYANVSIMRAHREIDAKQYGFIGNVSDPRQRFWSVEVHIQAISDEIFGIDHTKQSASKFDNYNLENDRIEGDIDEAEEMLFTISEWITSNIAEMMKQLKKDGSKGGGGGGGGGNDDDDFPFNPDGDVDVDDDDGKKVSDQDRVEAKKWILNRYPDEFKENPSLLKKNIDWFLALPCKHYIIYSDLGDIELYSFKTFGDKTLIEININHDFYDKFIRKIEDEDNDERRNIIWFLFSSMVVNEKRYLGTPEEVILKRLRATLATNLSVLMYKWYNAS